MPYHRVLLTLVTGLFLLSLSAPPALAQVEGSRWTAPTYGFQVSWAGTDWEADPAGTLTAVGPERLDRVHLINGASSLYFEGATRYEGDLSSCVAEEANILSQEAGVSEVRPYRDDQGDELIADGPDASAAAFTLTLEVAEGEIELVDYVECRTLIPGEAVLIITLVTDPGIFEQELATAQAVMDTITLAGNIPTSPLEAYGGWIATAQERPSVAGPLTGDLAFGPGQLAVERAGVDLSDFYARAQFTNPDPGETDAWDFGLGFRDLGEDDQMRLVVDSTGNWFLKESFGPVIAQGTLVDVDTSQGGQNIIELVAVGDVGYFAFNERLVTELDLSSRVESGDIFAGAGFFTEDAESDGRAALSEFEVWSLSGLDSEPATIPASPVDQAAFPDLVAAAQAATPLAGPTTGELIQTVGAAAVAPAGVLAEDFVASATFVNPIDATESPWDFGIAFREQSNGDHYRLTVASDGTWEFQIGTQPEIAGGAVPALNLEAGATNILEVVVAGDSAGFAVNGSFVSPLDVSALHGAEDVWIGAGFHRANVSEDQITPFEDFTVWPVALIEDAGEDVSATPAASGDVPEQIALRLHEQDDSGIDALAVLRESEGRTVVTVAARDTTGGEVVVLQDAACDADGASPAFLLEDVDETGLSESTIGARLAEIADGQHAIAIHSAAESFDNVVACGDIPALE